MSDPSAQTSQLPQSDPVNIEPPPGFDAVGDDDRRRQAPDVLPEPVFGRARATQATSRADWDGSSSSAAEATQHEWYDHGKGRWDGHSSQSWGSGWDKGGRWEDHQQHRDWNRRSSWDTAASTTADGAEQASRKKPSHEDPWKDGNDPWATADGADQFFRKRQSYEDKWKGGNDTWSGHRSTDWTDPVRDDGGHRDPWRDPKADGRADDFRGHDHPEGHASTWSGVAPGTNAAWSGWSFYDNGGFMSGNLPRNALPSGGRASEKLAVPTFSGEDSEDIGGSARSYLRQIEAWRRMTMLPASQQGLVLYQNLTGKAWIAAEELSMNKLASDSGVEYFVDWLKARFLDLEVARIGRAFSEFFRKLRRKPSQTIREYNTEYDRLHARLREVGCSLPQECAAWLYVDRLQLDEPQELNLLASVGNQYNLGKLQQAAVLHDRGHRKPWESKGRKPHTTHLTENGEDGGGFDDHEDFDDLQGECIPEEVAVAYATYQSAKDKYKEQAKSRGYNGDRGNGGGHDKPGSGGTPTREEKIKLMKARSYCMSCGKKGHWHKDQECPNRGNAKEIEMCHHVPAEVYALRHEGRALLGITDTACAKSVAGTVWLQHYSDCIEEHSGKPELVRESEAFKFGTGKVHHSAFHIVIRFKLGSRVVEMKCSIINGDIPLLLSKSALAQLGMIYDVAQNCADFTKVGLSDFPLVTTSSGHPAIQIVPAKPGDTCTKLVIEDAGALANRAYMAFATSAVKYPNLDNDSFEPQDNTFSGSNNIVNSSLSQHATVATSSTTTSNDSCPRQPEPQWGTQYKIFYDKKLPSEVRELLTQDQLHEASFINWWRKTKIASDFWLEGEHVWHRIHVTPRRALCNPRSWKTNSTMQKDMLLKSISDVRVTEGFCCKTEKPLETAVDRWRESGGDHSFSLMWIGRSTFAKLSRSSPLCSSPIPSQGHGSGMQQHTGNQQDDENAAVERGQQAGLGRAYEVVSGGDQGGDSGAPHDVRGFQPGAPNEVCHEFEHAGLEGQGDRTWSGVSVQHHKREPPAAHSGSRGDPSERVDEDWQVQGMGVRRDSEGVRQAAREVRMSSNPHVELVRFAKWWEEDQYEKNYGNAKSIEANAVTPYPTSSPPRATPSEATSSAWDGSEWKVTSWPDRDDYPIHPKNTKRGSSSNAEANAMEQEIDPGTLEEIRALEMRLAVLKSKAKVGTSPTK